MDRREEIAERLEVEARAKIAWGHDAATVEGYLTGGGVAANRAQRIVREAVAARDSGFRQKGVLDCLLAGLLVAPVGWILWVVHRRDGWREAAETAVEGPVLFLLLGGWLLSKGLTRIVFGGRGEDGPTHAADGLNTLIVEEMKERFLFTLLVVVGVVVAYALR